MHSLFYITKKYKTMKKLISLLFCSAIICSAFAQRNHHNKRYNNYPVYLNNNYRYNERTRQIQRINNEYNFRISQVNNNWTLRRGQKKHAIKKLEKQRAFEIRQVNARFNDYGYNNKNHNGSYNRNYHHSHNSHHNNNWNNQ